MRVVPPLHRTNNTPLMIEKEKVPAATGRVCTNTFSINGRIFLNERNACCDGAGLPKTKTSQTNKNAAETLGVVFVLELICKLHKWKTLFPEQIEALVIVVEGLCEFDFLFLGNCFALELCFVVVCLIF